MRPAMPTDVHQVLYASQLGAQFGPEAVRSILQVSREHNRVAGLSGALLFDGARFVQLLEGEGPPLASLMRRIETDRRHSHYRLLHDAASARGRRCSGWVAGYVDAEHVDAFHASLAAGADAVDAFVIMLGDADVI